MISMRMVAVSRQAAAPRQCDWRGSAQVSASTIDARIITPHQGHHVNFSVSSPFSASSLICLPASSRAGIVQLNPMKLMHFYAPAGERPVMLAEGAHDGIIATTIVD